MTGLFGFLRRRGLPAGLYSRPAVECLRPLLPQARGIEPPPDAPWHVAGYFSAPTGLGQSARLFLEEKRREGCDARPVDLTAFMGMPRLPGPDGSRRRAREAGEAPGVVVIHCNPPAFMFALWAVRRLAKKGRIIAYWAWELESVPAFWARCAEHVDEILVPSAFVAEAVKKRLDRPVRVHPHAVGAPCRPRGLPEEARPFTVLCCCEAASGFWRKNPLAAVAAFKEAFGASPRARLIVKIGGPERCPEGVAALAKAADAANIRFCLGYVSEQGMDDLYAEADAYLSLHRSEGYGLHIREAMLRGLAVIATGWSGNMDFMRGENCRAVPYSLVPARDPQNRYSGLGARWAEPDVAAAARMLREAREEAAQAGRRFAS
jgi:glycosyltransferase involved in cell wall biosynthesis